MPEIKNTFTQGKMNKDLDERIIPNGQYKDALNVKVNSSDDASVGTVQNILGNLARDTNGIVPGDYLCIATIADEKSNKLYWFVTKELVPVHAILQYDLDLKKVEVVLLDKNDSTLKFSTKIITGINIIDDLLFWTDGVNEPKKININDCIKGSVTQDLDTAPQTVLVDNDGIPTGIDIEERHITVIKKAPRLAPQAKILSEYDGEAALFEKVFPRFSYRYKYKDGEYSSFGPFTDVIFKPVYKDEYTSDNAYSLEEGNNVGMVNNIKAIEFYSYNYDNLPEDVVQVELLYKEDGSSVVFSVKKINNDDTEWSLNRFTLDSQDIFAAIPENQLLRVWDNVPKKALAQEVTGNRIIYGNYTQGENLISSDGTKSKVRVISNYEGRNLDYYPVNDDTALGGIPSLKSQREYNVGLVWGDKYGRETPVMESTGSSRLPWSDQFLNLLASHPTSLRLNVAGKKPHWADYYKFYVKEKSGEYYNLLMEKAYFTNKVNIFEEGEERIWLGFVSSDRNKLQDQEYIILKKKVGANQTQIPLQNKFKILDIVNEAPDAIKYRYADIGRVTHDFDGSGSYLNTIFTDIDQRPNAEIDMLYIDRSEWVNGTGGSLQQSADNKEMWVENLYASWRNFTTGERSERYRIISSVFNTSEYMLKLDRKISAEDAALGLGGATAGNLSGDLEFLMEKREEVEVEELSGKFYVQISSLSSVQPSQDITVSNYMISSSQSTHWFYNTATLETLGGTGNPLPSIEPDTVEDAGFTGHVGGLTNSESDFAAIVTSAFDDTASFPAGRGFFIDSLYMVGGQISSSNYAKSTGRTWMGRRDNHRPYTPRWGQLITGSEFNNSGGGYSQFTNNESEYGWGIGNAFTFGTYIGKRLAFIDQIYDDNGDSYATTNNFDQRWEQGQVLRTETGQSINNAHIKQSMEGMLTTTAQHCANHANGYKRWRKEGSINNFPHNYWNGEAEFTYGTQAGVHYIEISFMAPGVDLHDTNWGALNDDAPFFGNESIGAYLQGIWGGGVFNDIHNAHSYPNNTLYVEMEGNYDPIDGTALAQAPGPGVGYGYDTSGDNFQNHTNQWDPTYPSDPGGKIAKFISKLAQGNKFTFSSNPDVEFEILANPKVKKIYNHTAWNIDYNYDGSIYVPLSRARCVQRKVLQWANADSADKAARMAEVKTVIQNFGKANNRRISYIFPVDKDPLLNVNSGITATNFDAIDALDIQFRTKDSSYVLEQIMTEPAIWETEPKENGLDIYYEASQAFPTKITSETNVEFAPIGSYVEIELDAARNGQYIITGKMVLARWTESDVFRVANRDQDGFNAFSDDSGTVVDYTDALVKFYRSDGSYTTGKILGPSTQGEVNDIDTGVPYTPTTDYYNEFIIETDVDTSLDTGISYYNCFTFGNGIESNRIRDDFNNPTIKNGVKASIILDTDYKEEHRKSGLIFSGIYNSNSGVNNLNQFIMAENITKDLNPTYGSIQKLFQRRISLVAFCEDRTVSITSNKDSLFNADGNSQLVSTNAVLGDATPFVGDFGISKNPESFAKESYRAYFADKQRGAVLRLSMDGITDISNAGMDDYFRDNLKESGEIVGSFDAYSKDFNITLRSKKASDNFIINAFFNDGVNGNLDFEAENQQFVTNGSLNNLGQALYLPQLSISGNPYTGNSELHNRYLNFKTNIVNHAAILAGSIAPETQSYSTTQSSSTTFTTSALTLMQMPFTITSKGNPFKNTGSSDSGNGYGGNDKKYIAQRNYTSSFTTANEAGVVTYYPTSPVGPAGSHSNGWYTGLDPLNPGSNFGMSSDIFWNPVADGYAQQTPPLNEIPFGISASNRHPWFNVTSGPHIGRGIAFDSTFATQELILPGIKKTSTDIITPTSVLNEYSSAVPTTVFNGEEIRIIFGARGMSYSVFGQSYGSGTSNPNESSSDHHRYVTIQLYDGNTALTDSVIMDPSNLPGGISQSYADYKYVPNTGAYEVGFKTEASIDFPTLTNNTDYVHDVSFKFTNGVDESEAIIVQDLQVRIRFVDDAGNYPDNVFGSISSFTMQKQYYMSDVDSFTTTTTNNADAVPPQNIPAFAEVNKIGYTYWAIDTDLNSGIDETPFQRMSENKFGNDYIAVSNPYTQTWIDINGNTQTNSGSYISPPDPSGTNGVVAYNDYSTGDETVNDVFVFDSLGDDHFLVSSSVSLTTGDKYAIALMRAYSSNSGNTTIPNSPGDGTPPTGDVPSLPDYNEDFVLTQVPYEFTDGNASHPAYLCIFDGDSSINQIRIKIPGNANLEFETINMINVSETWSGGQANNWVSNLGSTGNPTPTTAFDLPQVYASASDGIVFNVQGSGLEYYTSIKQTITNLNIIGGYIFTFSAVVTDGALSFKLLGQDGNGAYGADVIDRTGNYRIHINALDGGSYNVEIDEGSGTFNIVTQVGAPFIGQFPPSNMLIFHDGNNFKGSIDNISLVNAQALYSGGSAGAFNFTGFNPNNNNFIVWNNGEIQFNDCPGIDATDPSNLNFFQLQQYISPQFHPTNLGDTYKIRFDYDFDPSNGNSGGINGYFYNGDGDGFIIGDVGGITGSGTYNVVHTIGESTNPDPSVYLTNTLVIYSNAAPGTFTNGYIDNILFRQEFEVNFGETVSFSEDVRGWTSRKSFVPEQGVSLSSSYFTFNTGQIYEHNIETYADAVDPAIIHVQPRNTFYGVVYPSTITTMLNAEPGTMKSFNTLNYEGSQSKVNQYQDTVIDGNNYNTLNNYNIVDKKGWEVNYIKTNKQEGYVTEFIEKEGKWFNYIKGSNDQSTVDTSDLSFQGLGTIKIQP